MRVARLVLAVVCFIAVPSTAQGQCPSAVWVNGQAVSLSNLPQAMFGQTQQVINGNPGDTYQFGFSPCVVVPSNGINPSGAGCNDNPAFLQQFSASGTMCWDGWGTLQSVQTQGNNIMFNYVDGKGWPAIITGVCDSTVNGYATGPTYQVTGSGSGPYTFSLTVSSSSFCPGAAPPPPAPPTNSSCPSGIVVGDGVIDLEDLGPGTFTSQQILDGVVGGQYLFGFSPCLPIPTNGVNPSGTHCSDNPAFLQQFGVNDGFCYSSFGAASPPIASGDDVLFRYSNSLGWYATVRGRCGPSPPGGYYFADPTYTVEQLFSGVYVFNINVTSEEFCVIPMLRRLA